MNKPTAEQDESPSLSQQQYIEAIAALMKTRGQARASELAAQLGVSMPSVSQAIDRLVALGLVVRQSRREILLSPKGQEVAAQLAGQEAALRRFMVDVIALPESDAARLACRVEHCVDRQFTDRLLQMAEFLQRESPWTLQGIRQYLQMRAGAPAGQVLVGGVPMAAGQPGGGADGGPRGQGPPTGTG